MWWNGSRCGGVEAVAVNVVESGPLRWMWWSGSRCGGCGGGDAFAVDVVWSLSWFLCSPRVFRSSLLQLMMFSQSTLS